MAQLKDLLVSGAARFLNGLNINGDLIIAGNLLPAKNETYNLGDSSHRWRQTQTKYLSVGAGDISSSGYEAVISGDLHTTGYSLFDDYVQIGGARDNTAYKFYVNGKTHLKGDTRITGNLLMTTGNTAIYWDDGTYRQRILTTDDSTVNTAVFNFQQSENTGSSWKNLLEIRDNGRLILTNKTGGIYRVDNAATSAPLIHLSNNNVDSSILRIDGNDRTSVVDTQAYGFDLKYIGTGGGEANSLDLIADNMNSTNITAISVSNNGKVGIGAKYDTNYRLYVNGSSYLGGNNFLYGDISALYDSIDQYLKYTLEGIVANHAAKLSLYRITASGTTKTPGSQIRGILLDASTGFIELNAAASNPSTTAGARIAFKYDGGQPVYLAYTPNDSYRAPYGLKILGSDGSAPGAWLEVEGNLYIGSASNSNTNNNAALYIRGLSAIEGYDTWLRLNDNSSFSSGTYSPKLIRSDEALQVGNNGSKFYASSNGNGYFSNTLGIAGTNTSYKLYVNGTSYFNGNTIINGKLTSTYTKTILESPATSRLTSADITIPSTGNGGIRMRIDAASSSMITNNPGMDGYIITFNWDNNSIYHSQLFLPIGYQVASNMPLKIRGQKNSDGSWASWKNIPIFTSSSSTDNAITRFDGTNGNIQNSLASIGDSGELTAPYIGVNGKNTTYRLYVNGTSYFTNYLQTASYFKSTVATGTAPVQVTSTTLNTNLNADLLDGYHLGEAQWIYSNTYNQPTSGQVWYLKIQTSDWNNTSETIYLRGTGDNTSGTVILKTGSRHSAWWGYATNYNGTNIVGVKKIVSNSDDVYIKIASGCTQVIVKTTFSPRISASTDTTGYTNVPSIGGLFGNSITFDTFYGPLNGNAATATALTSSAGNAGQPIYFGSGKPIAIDWHIGNSGVGEHNANNVTYNFCGYYTSNGPATSIGASTTDGALYAQAHSSSWVGQIAQDYRNGGLYVRGKNNGTWQSWYSVLDTRNYTSILDSRYVNATGDTITGELYVDGGTTLASLLVKGDARFVNTIQGNITSADKLNTNAGSLRQPVYFNGGKPVVAADDYVFYDETNSFAGGADSIYVKLAGDTMTGQLNATAGLRWNHAYWNPSGNVFCTPTANNQEWSIDVGSASYTGSQFHIWSVRNGASILQCYDDNRHVAIPVHLYIGGYNNTSYALSTSSFICNSWIRTTGSTGWYNETYGGGWYMTDSTYIRTYNGKMVYGSGRFLSPSTSSSWLDGQRYNRGGYNLEDATDNGSYWPWLRQTNTSVGKWFSFGTLGTSFYWIGSSTSRTDNGYDFGMSFNISNGYLQGCSRVYGAVWNDYAEYRNQIENILPGYCVVSHDNGKICKTNERLQACDGIVSDTYGFAIGETDDCKTPVAVAGRVLAYCEGDRKNYHAGDTVCATINGLVTKMTREEIREYPDRIVGIVSEIPDYETWGTENAKVDGRIWIKVR